MRKRTRHIGSGLCSLVSVVIPVFDTVVIIVTDGSYELQKKVTCMMSDRSDRLLSGITKENCSHVKPIYMIIVTDLKRKKLFETILFDFKVSPCWTQICPKYLKVSYKGPKTFVRSPNAFFCHWQIFCNATKLVLEYPDIYLWEVPLNERGRLLDLIRRWQTGRL